MSARQMALDLLTPLYIGLVASRNPDGSDEATIFNVRAAIAALKAELAQPSKIVAWADDNAMRGAIGNVATNAAKAYWMCSGWQDKAMADKLTHPLFAASQHALNAELSDDDIADLYFNRGCQLHTPGTDTQHKALIAFARAAIAKATGGAA